MENTDDEYFCRSLKLKSFLHFPFFFLNCHLMYERLVLMYEVSILCNRKMKKWRNEKDKLNSMENFKDMWQVKNNISIALSLSHSLIVIVSSWLFDYWNTLTHNVRFGKCFTMAKCYKWKCKFFSNSSIFSIIS